MRLCFLATGDSVHSYRWIRFFADRGHETHWLSLTDCAYPPHERIHFERLGRGKGRTLELAGQALRIRKIVRSIRPDIVHAHYAGSYGLLGLIAGVRPFVVTAWGSDILVAGKQWGKSSLIRAVLSHADLITCDAHHIAEAIRRLGAAPEKIQIVHFGVETDRFFPGSADQEIVSRWAVENRPVVISLRQLEPIYDIETLLKAMPLVARACPAVHCIIASSGSLEQTLRASAAAKGLNGHVQFIGRYANAELPRMLRCAQVYVSTSLSDAGIAASTAEAMACGLPVVVTNTGENDRWITDGETGFLVKSGDSQALAERIIGLLNDAALRESMGKRARRTIETRNGYVQEMEKMQRYYIQLASQAAAVGGNAL
ncbi:MAG TPA: glycosyltransferase [Burkholderiales bacterium]|nr:glycosyltransferase [Burkholderiales bacterium]